MKTKNNIFYKQWVDDNTDDHGIAVLKFADDWAVVVEAAVATGLDVDTAIRETWPEDDGSREEAMYFLHRCWVHGNALHKLYRVLCLDLPETPST